MEKPPRSRLLRQHGFSHKLAQLLVVVTACIALWAVRSSTLRYRVLSQPEADILHTCRALNVRPGPPDDFPKRTVSDRFAKGTRSTLIRNATIWTGRENGQKIIRGGDVLLDRGLVKAVGKINRETLRDLNVIEADGRWVTPGVVDMHSHIGLWPIPFLLGANDGNSYKGPILPGLRSIDALNTHDLSYNMSIAGGVTTALLLPGSINAIGGQAFTIKLRATTERTPTSFLLEPPASLLSPAEPLARPRWRHMKHACGENPNSAYTASRMDTQWSFRKAYETARKLKASQDAYCAQAETGNWVGLGIMPNDLEYESLVDVLRGRVKVHNHCYEIADIDAMIRLTNEYEFEIAAFHHAHEAFLMPDRIKEAYGKTPAVALFASSARFKREAYLGSEFAPRILSAAGIEVAMKSDHPVLNSRHLIYEAQQAHYYGMGTNVALASVISTPAKILGLDHRVGYLDVGYDADVVLWDSHPLALGATPVHVWIDGVSQHFASEPPTKAAASQKPPRTPNFDQEAIEVVQYDGLPPLGPKKTLHCGTIIFANVSKVYVRTEDQTIREYFSSPAKDGVVVVEDGKIKCTGSCALIIASMVGQAESVDLQGGSISPGLVSYGSTLGLVSIIGEASTNDGPAPNPLSPTNRAPIIVGGDGYIAHALDGLQLSTRNAEVAYQAGVTIAITGPQTSGFVSGLSVAFATGTTSKLAKGAILQPTVALHVIIGQLDLATPRLPISTHIAALRALLNGGGIGEMAAAFKRVVLGNLPLVIAVNSADTMASLIILKTEVDAKSGVSSKWTFTGAGEAHLLAEEIAAANIGVIITTARPFSIAWDSQRISPGPPLSEHSALTILRRHNVTVGLGIIYPHEARNARFDAAWAALESSSHITTEETLALVSVNVEKLLGVNAMASQDLVATSGGPLLGFESKVLAVLSGSRGRVDMW